MTLWVSGIPKMTCQPRDIKHLFNSVAQVKSIEMDHVQGYAKVILFDESSASFVADKTWHLNGSSLCVSTSYHFCKERKWERLSNGSIVASNIHQKKAVQKNYETPYQLYKRNANTFWLDVPHHRAMMKKKVHPKRKLTMPTPKKGCNTVAVVEKLIKEHKKKRKKRNVLTENQNTPANNPNFLSLGEFSNYIEKLIKEIDGLENTTKREKIEKDVTCTSKLHSTEDISTNKHCIPNDRCIIISAKPSEEEIPIYVYFKGKMTVVKVHSISQSETEIKKKITEYFCVPSELQLLLSRGKVLGPDCGHSLKAYDNICVLIRGKGGMQDSNIDISPSSPEKDVTFWLKNEVCLSEDIFKKYGSILSELDGRTLYSYDVENVKSFIEDTDIPIGTGRKILAFRDKKFHGISNGLIKLPSQEISEFVKETINTKDKNAKQLIKGIVEREIDGYVFYSYKDEKQFQEDFNDLNLKGMVFKKIILRRNEVFQSTFTNSEDKVTTVLDSSQPKQNEHAGSHSGPGAENSHRRQICNLFSLNEIPEGDHMACRVKIIYASWNNMNELEKKFLFILICQKSEYTDKNQQSGLWKQISENFHLWLNRLPADERKSFSESAQNGVYIHNKKKVQLSKPCHLAFVKDKKIESLLNFSVPIILVSKSIFRHQCNGFVARLSGNYKNPEKLHFSFQLSAEYFFFDPDDYAEGFKIEKYCGKQRANTEKDSKDNTTRVDEIPKSDTYKKKEEEQITMLQSKDAECNESKIKEAACSLSGEIKTEVPRNFKEKSDYVKYHEGYIFSQPENDGTLFLRCFEFKSFFSAGNRAKETRLIKFQKEVLRFACGCLNARKDGTIYFGIADSVKNIDSKPYRHGEIVGFTISETEDDSRTSYTDALKDGIRRCFDSDTAIFAEKCISNPIFVKVIVPLENCRYVMEVDVEPISSICQNYHFKVNIGHIQNFGSKSEENKYLIFVRRGASTEKIKKEGEHLFIRLELPDFVKGRMNFDEQKKFLVVPCETLAKKLERLLTRDRLKFDKNLWPILLSGKPNEEQKLQERLIESLYFIKTIHLAAVFDFDDFSNKDGLCHFYRNPERSELCTEERFHEKAGNLQDLANEFGLLYKDNTVWILANGKDEGKPHVSRSEWHKLYSAGICDAVSFFNQSCVIPKGRAVIIVLLLSFDFDGLIDTFNEITRKFGWGPIVIISENKRIFDSFSETIQQEGKGSEKELDDVSVIGMPWAHVSSTIASINGYIDNMDCVLPCSSGAYVNIDSKFIDTLVGLRILSAKECENLKKERCKEKAIEEEMQFYKGQKVTWWNFHFETHVCKRNKYEILNQRAHYLLTNASQQNSNVIKLIIAHEPGAGATTVGHQLLWNLRFRNRCSVIEKYSKVTTQSILSLWKYEEEQCETSPNPVVVLLDDIESSEMTIFDFIRELDIAFRKNQISNGMKCLAVICQRHEKLQNDTERQNVHYLKQELTEGEKSWFNKKYAELDKTGREMGLEDFKPSHLISFMVMREGFNQEYIKNTVKHLISEIDSSANEYKLVKYMSFLTTYTLRGVNAYVPLQCFDALMVGGPLIWERRMSSSAKALLLITEEEQYSGQRIRLAHRSFGEAVLNEIMKRENEHIADIAKDFLKSPIFRNDTFGKKHLIDNATNMLIRRKKEEYDDEKNTKFSPLVEKILEDSEDSNSCFLKAAEVLQLGFDNFKDSMIAQALARLYLQRHDFNKAMEKIEDAVNLSKPAALSFICHTKGLVLREKFKDSISQKTFCPENVPKYLEVILKSLDVFNFAQERSDNETDIQQKMVCLFEVIRTINEITKFLMKNISYDMEKTEVLKYLKDETYIPSEINDIWARFHQRFKDMKKQAYDAFDVLEDNACFATIYSSEETLINPGRNRKVNRFYQYFQNHGHRKEFSSFSSIYGVQGPPEDGMDQLAMDSYHRERLLTLRGNSYMNIFNHIKYSRNRSIKDEIFQKLDEIREHVTQIESKTPNDLANQVCVNIALGILGWSRPEPELKIFKMCQQIISLGAGKVNLAYFFITMLLWPCDSGKKKFFDASRLETSLGFLKKNVPQQNQNQTVQFFLAKGKGLKSLCHRCQVPGFVRDDSGPHFDVKFWEDPETAEILRRLRGSFVKEDWGDIIIYKYMDNNSIKISKIRGRDEDVVSGKEVTFYLGFSIAGPIAYNVTLECHKSKSQLQSHHALHTFSKVEDYQKYPKEKLRKLLRDIKNLQEQRPDRLKERQKELIKDEDFIKEALDRQEIDSGEEDLLSFIDYK